MTHTRWIITPNGKIRTTEQINEQGGDYICKMPFSTAAEADRMPNARANAYLIAAAPELLTACKDILADCEAALAGTWDKGDEGFRSIENRLKKVIRKSGGDL